MIPLPSIVDFLFIISFIVTLRALHNRQRRRVLPYPPGPRPLPLIGNLLDIPRESSWLAYTPLAKKYGTSYNFLEVSLYMKLAGDVMSFHVLGRVIVILSSTKATKALLKNCGHVYSDRPMITIFEMCAPNSDDSPHSLLICLRMDVHHVLPFASFSAGFRLARRIAERGFRPASLAQYFTLQERKTHVLVTRILENPQEWVAHIELSGHLCSEIHVISLNYVPGFRANNSLL